MGAETTELIPMGNTTDLDILDQASQEAALKLHSARTALSRGHALAMCVKTLRTLLTPEILADFTELQNSKLGFLTDRKEGYDAVDLRDIIIDGLIRGLSPVGNQFNVIAGNIYVTKEGFTHLLGMLRPLTELDIRVGNPTRAKDNQQVAFMECVARWKWYGEPDQLEFKTTDNGDFRIMVKVNSGMGADALLGKGRSKVLRKVYEHIMGSQHALPYIDDDQTIDADDVSQVEPEKLFDENGYPTPDQET